MTEWLLTFAAIGGLVVASRGLDAWKKQLRGTAEWELARRFLRQVYAARDSLRAARSMYMTGAEQEAALTSLPNRTPSRTPANDGLIAGYQKRWERVQRVLSDLDLEAIEAEVLWGPEAQRCMAPLRECAHEFYVSLSQYLRWQSGSGPRPEESYANQVDRIIFPIPGDDGRDSFGEQLDQAIRTVEAFVRPHLRR